jgi:uncharacterized protein (DUF1810 family)
MTLFEVTALERKQEADRFSQALDAFYQGCRDDRTLSLLA